MKIYRPDPPKKVGLAAVLCSALAFVLVVQGYRVLADVVSAAGTATIIVGAVQVWRMAKHRERCLKRRFMRRMTRLIIADAVRRGILDVGTGGGASPPISVTITEIVPMGRLHTLARRLIQSARVTLLKFLGGGGR